MSLNRYYDRQGNAIEGTSDEDIMFKWAGLFEDVRYRVVASTYLPDGTHVSTIWLGMDHGFHFLQPDVPSVPVIFETMTFRPLTEGEIKDNQSSEYEFIRRNQREDVDQWRYTTEAEAIVGHWDAAVNWMRDLSATDQEQFVKGLSDADRAQYEQAVGRILAALQIEVEAKDETASSDTGSDTRTDE